MVRTKGKSEGAVGSSDFGPMARRGLRYAQQKKVAGHHGYPRLRSAQQTSFRIFLNKRYGNKALVKRIRSVHMVLRGQNVMGLNNVTWFYLGKANMSEIHFTQKSNKDIMLFANN